jgi:dihydropteroate synthase
MFTQRKRFLVTAGRFNLELDARTLIMGIMNLTADSFSGDGLLKNSTRSLVIKKALGLAQDMARNGADIIDIGAESSRPGAKPISIEEELRRIVPVLQLLSKRINKPISVDTYKPQVAQVAIEAGASIINYILTSDARTTQEISRLCARKKRALILMHMRGVPATMQEFSSYRSLIGDIKRELKQAISVALKAGLPFKNIIIDPGIGFAKTAQQNLQILNQLKDFADLKRPILIGVSRKSFIGKVLNLDEKSRLFGTAASVALAIAGGAHIVRVHDVSQMHQVATMTDAIIKKYYVRVS